LSFLTLAPTEKCRRADRREGERQDASILAVGRILIHGLVVHFGNARAPQTIGRNLQVLYIAPASVSGISVTICPKFKRVNILI